MTARVIRPRPVTATVTKSDIMANFRRRQRRLSTSTGSTDSLLSVLDHESCSSRTSQGESDTNQNSRVTCDTESRLDDLHISKNDVDETSTTTITHSENESEAGHILSPWQRWMIKKTQLDRAANLKVVRERCEKKDMTQKSEEEQIEKVKKVDEKRKEWTDKKNTELKLQKRLEKQKQLVEADLKRIEKCQLQLKAEHKYNEWLDKKREEEMKQKEYFKMKKLKEEFKKCEQRQKAEDMYNEWKNRVTVQRPMSACTLRNSLSTGSMPSLRSYPSPTYINPRPWIHPAVSVTRSSTRKTKGKSVKPKRHP